MTAETLNCPTCGAAISSDATSCQYCGSKLATVACPSCFGMAFLGSKFCPHCGKELVWPAEVDTSLRCPRCRVGATMAVVALGDTKLLECRRCCGLWVAVATFERICDNQEQQAAVLALNLPPPVAPAEVDPGRRYLPCPKCGGLMNRVNFAHRSGVIVDVCRADGVWFDRDELRRIIEFIRNGGLEHARQIEAQEMEDRVRELEGIQTRISPTSVFNDVHEGELASALAVAGGWLGRLLS